MRRNNDDDRQYRRAYIHRRWSSVTLACDNPNAMLLFVTDKRISAIPVGALSNSALP